MIVKRQRNYSKAGNTVLGLTAAGLAAGTIAGNSIEASRAKKKAIEELSKEDIKRLAKEEENKMISELMKDGYTKKEAKEIAKDRYNEWRDESPEYLREKIGKEAAKKSWTSADSKGGNIGAAVGSGVGLASGLILARKVLKK